MSKAEQQVVPYAGKISTSRIILYLLIITALSSLAIGFVYDLFYGIDQTTISLDGLAVACLILLVVYSFGYHQTAGFFLSLVVSAVLTFNISVGNAIYDEAMLGYPLIIVFTGLLFGKLAVALMTGITAGQILLVYLLARRGLVSAFNGLMPVTFEQTATSILIMVATGMMLWVVIDIIERTVRKLLQAEREMENTYDLTLEAWAQALELRGREPSGHSRRVSAMSVRFAHWLGFDREKTKHVRRGALLHDIGKMGIPEEILLKRGPLTEEEWQVVSQHPLLATEIFKDVPYLQEALEIVRYHHEQPDGQGYPFKLQDEDIPDSAKLFSIVDNWDILRSYRSHNRVWGKQEILEYITSEAGKKFDSKMAESFIAMLKADYLNGGSDGI
jgi:putative nucleotidyltransferase with HDIG domain